MNYKVVAPLFCLALAGCNRPTKPGESEKGVDVGDAPKTKVMSPKIMPSESSSDADAEDDAIQKTAALKTEFSVNDERLKKIVEFVRKDGAQYARSIVNATIDCTAFPSGDDEAKCHQIEETLKLTDEKSAYPSSRLQISEALTSVKKFEKPYGLANGIRANLQGKLELSVFELATWLECGGEHANEKVWMCETYHEQLSKAAAVYMEKGIIEGLEDAIMVHLAHIANIRQDKLENLGKVFRKLEQSTELFKALTQRSKTDININNICQSAFEELKDQEYSEMLWTNVVGTGLDGKELPEALVTAIYRLQAETMTFIVWLALVFGSASIQQIQPVIDIGKEIYGSVELDANDVVVCPIRLYWPKIWKFPDCCHLDEKGDTEVQACAILAENGMLYKQFYEPYYPRGKVINLGDCKEYVDKLKAEFTTLRQRPDDDGRNSDWNKFVSKRLTEKQISIDDVRLGEGLERMQNIYIPEVTITAKISDREAISWFFFVFVVFFAVVYASRQRESLVHRGDDGFDLGCQLPRQCLSVEI